RRAGTSPARCCAGASPGSSPIRSAGWAKSPPTTAPTGACRSRCWRAERGQTPRKGGELNLEGRGEGSDPGIAKDTPMINHISIGVRDIARAKRFYDAALAPLGYSCLSQSEGSLGYGRGSSIALWISAV